MTLLIFSDIHADFAALQALMSTEADRYIAAGDLVNWCRGVERAGPILTRCAEQVTRGARQSFQDSRCLARLKRK